MRVEFTQSVAGILNEDHGSVFISGDLGFNAFEKLAATVGRRFLNAGVAEQNMVGVAAGIALTGLKPWVYSIVPFVTFRCLEQIRNDVCFHNLPVRLVGNGGGYTYGIMGSTHHALEDLSVLKAMPNLSLFFPCSGDQVDSAVKLIHKLDGPSYLRLSISPFSTKLDPLNENPVTLTRRYTEGSIVTVIGIGHATQIALNALKNHGQDLAGVELFSISRFPFDSGLDNELIESVRKTKRVIFLEEHYRAGGIAESIVPNLPLSLKYLEIMSATYSINQRYGSSAFHLNQSGLTPAHLIAKINQGKMT